MAKQLSAEIKPRCPNNFPILETIATSNIDLCLKNKLEESDLDILGVHHCHRQWHEADFHGVSDAWLD